MITDKEIQQLRNEGYDYVADEIEDLREALHKIATGTGYYGAMAREYKNIARKALGMELV